MAEVNMTFAIEFFLLGFSDFPNLQEFLFVIFLVIYLSILIGNGLIIVITKVEPSLQTPMYFFLGNFSFLEICYTSVTLPRILTDLWTQKKNISFLGCATQVFFILILGVTECFLLSVMAYDRFVAICKPLYYPLIMNHRMCVGLVIGSWIIGIPILIGLTYQIFSLSFCGSKKLEHVFCDIPPLLKLACGDISMEVYSIYVDAGIFGMFPFLFIFGSYTKIIATILKLPSANGRYKAFFTCSSHLIVVTLYFGSASLSYLMPNSSHSSASEIVLSLFYTIVTPMFNPLIYSLRNTDFIMAMRKLLPKYVGLIST
ncbi:olfactory receptor 10AG1-like [Dromiciops gliroides]|uniref:olfactory receptor 10AG1-like n=1 Tax=Dromiciops gliroides TaxID=33562 RepID=UPI001CC4DB13|nr:olfactory receptor 10AG1-like [Dromiciops gliroides]